MYVCTGGVRCELYRRYIGKDIIYLLRIFSFRTFRIFSLFFNHLRYSFTCPLESHNMYRRVCYNVEEEPVAVNRMGM